MSETTLPRINPQAIRHRLAQLSTSRILIVIALIVGALLVVGPFLWMFSTSMRPPAQAYDLPPNWIPGRLSSDNYTAALGGPVPLVRNTINSLVIAVATTFGVLVTSSMAGYAFAKDFREERGHAHMLVDQTYTERQIVALSKGLRVRGSALAAALAAGRAAATAAGCALATDGRRRSEA